MMQTLDPHLLFPILMSSFVAWVFFIKLILSRVLPWIRTLGKTFCAKLRRLVVMIKHQIPSIWRRKQGAQPSRAKTQEDESMDAQYRVHELLMRIETSNVAADIEEAIGICHKILDQRGEGHPERDEPLRNLAQCLRKKFERQGITADLHKAISHSQTALKLCPIGHQNRPGALGEFAICLTLRFGLNHQQADVDQAIALFQDALDLCPVGHPMRPKTLFNLALAFEARFGSQRNARDLDKALFLLRQGLELCPVGHPDRAGTLSCLAHCLRSRSELLRVPADLKESIFHFRSALELHPVGHPERCVTLNNLALALARKVTKANLDEAVSLHRNALELRPVGHPFRPVSLDNLACSLKSRFDLQGAITDLNEAIDIRLALVQSHPSENSKQSAYLGRLADCLEARHRRLCQFSDLDEAMEIRREISDPNFSHPYFANKPLRIKQLVTDIVQEVLELLPPRLLHTQDGIICDRAMQVSMFQDSLQCQQLFLSLRTIQQRDIDNIRTQVAEYFRYAMLSHRWGEAEPLLEHVAGRSIYDGSTTSGHCISQGARLVDFQKLRNFCDVTRQRGFHWAWSDTCCINKNNNLRELQEAISSMFSWYKRSALTIIYLADISPDAGPGELSGSEWFRRGWTLQELLASHTVLFYSRNWTLYSMDECLDHKQNKVVLTELERTTGIPSCYLMNFCPGVDNARLRLEWASRRQTTYGEDIAYSLFGIFGLDLPVLYGEGSEKAIGRLLQEIISRSRNMSVLDWTGKASSYHSCFPANLSPYRFAPSVQPPMSNVAFERSLSRFRELIDVEDAHCFYEDLMALPFPHFANCCLLLPCISHRVHSMTFKDKVIDHYVYEAQATNLRPLMIASPNELVDSTLQKELPYVLVRVLDQNLLETIKGDEIDAGYEIMVELDRPFSALLLQKISRRTYCRVASSRTIVAHIDDSKDIVSSEITALNIV